ncbi:MAG: hypothetical protein JW881_20725 [Spirochaetales bacterium]|nr:hypothetical protein [Spirochaetales bacterium]
MRYGIALSLCIFLIITTSFAFAQDGDEISPTPVPEMDGNILNTYNTANGLENWDYEYDVSGLKKGMYNIIVQGKDRAGNITYGGPINIFIDPSSDLPEIGITNPTPGMRVGGSHLNIVGTCVDDDGVGKVEVKINDGEFVEAEGKDFWSFRLSTEGLADGKHTLTVRGTDINGTQGEELSRAFYIDTSRPVHYFTSGQSGALVSGKTALEGYVTDKNGIEECYVSEDNGKNFERLKLRYDKQEDAYYFSLSIDTKKKEEGPNVFWLKSVDTLGSTGYASFLFFVDNEGPELEILYPPPEEKVKGETTIVGKVTDSVGIQSLTYKWRDETGEIGLVAGNPYWSKEFAFHGFTGATEAVAFTVTDITGNTRTVNLKIPVDREADKPVIRLLQPTPDGTTSGNVEVYGFADDDDGCASLVYVIDNREAVSVPVKEGFSFTLDNLEPGKHRITCYGIDINGVEGDREKVEFVHTGAAAAITMESLVSKGETSDFLPGMAVDRYDNALLRGSITAYERFKQVQYRIGGEPEKSLSLKNTSDGFLKQFEIPVTKNLPYGIVKFAVTAIDVHDRKTEFISFVYLTNYAKRQGPPGIYYADAGLEGGRVPLSPDYPFNAFFHGNRVASVSLEPDIPELSVSERNGSITVTPSSGSFDGEAKIKVTTDRDEVFYSPAFRFVSDFSYFSQELNQLTISGVDGSQEQTGFYPGMTIYCADGKAKLEGELSAVVVKGEYRVNGGEFKKLSVSVKKGETRGGFSLGLPKDIPFGKNEVEIRVYDKAGGAAAHQSFFFAVDTAGGEGNDREGLYFIDSGIADDGSVAMKPGRPFVGFVNGREIASVTLNPPSDFLNARWSGNHAIVEAQKDGISPKTEITVVTADGREYRSDAYIFLADANPPEIELETPAAGTWVGERLVVKGRAHDNTGIDNVEYSTDGGATFSFLTMTREGDEVVIFEEIMLQGIADGDFSLVIRAQDGGNNIATRRVLLKKDTEPPVISFITPEITQKVNGTFTVTGLVQDAGRITKTEFSDNSETFEEIMTGKVFSRNVDLASYETIPEKFFIRSSDEGGNTSVMNPELSIDFEADKPVVEIQIPENGAVLRSDFIISGMVFDDDGVAGISYRIDDNEFTRIDGGNSFSIPVRLDDITDNEHTIEVQAEDIGGLKGDVVQSGFFVSKAEPVSQLNEPDIEVTARGIIELEGISEDANGIRNVSLSFDNGNSYSLMNGSEEWSYRLNTALLPDGVHRILVKAVDNTGTEGIHATILNVDNTPPVLSLDAPFDGQIADDACLIDGRVFDNIIVASLTLKIAPVYAEPGTEKNGGVREFRLATDGVFSQWIDISDLEAGWYNLQLEAADRGENVSILTRNIRVQQKTVVNRIEQIFPTDGESVSGYFTLCGRVISEKPVKAVSLLVDDVLLKSIDVDEYGYFSRECSPDEFSDGEHVIETAVSLEDGSSLSSGKQKLIYGRSGVWVKITNLKTGDFITDRPWLEGEAGYFLDPVEKEAGEAYKEYQRLLKKNSVDRIEVSLDNGKSFKSASGTKKWKFRLETQNITDGDVRIMVRASCGDHFAVTKAIVNNDDLAPAVTILNPEEGKRFNDKISVLGTASDENGLEDISINLRKGDKSGYSIPEFIQGMYFDTQVLGATVVNAGLGLTFFDQNVRLQVQAGIAPPGRFSGLVIGTKLIANIFKLPFDYLFGPDWAFFSMSFALGANFSYFTMSDDEIAFTDKGLVISAIFFQWEVAKFHFEDMTAFNTYSIYTEFDLWVLSSDIEGGVEPKFSAGLRIGIL